MLFTDCSLCWIWKMSFKEGCVSVVTFKPCKALRDTLSDGGLMGVDRAVRTNTGAAEGVWWIRVVCVLRSEWNHSRLISSILRLVDLPESFSAVCQNTWDVSEPFTKNTSIWKMIHWLQLNDFCCRLTSDAEQRRALTWARLGLDCKKMIVNEDYCRTFYKKKRFQSD